MARDPLRLYELAVRDGDVRLAELVHRRIVRALLARRVLARLLQAS